MIDKTLAFLAPHRCYGCGKMGTVLCYNCKYNIISEPYAVCMACGKLAGTRGLCGRCRVPYVRGWLAESYESAAGAVVRAHKFDGVRAAGDVLGGLLDETLPTLPPHCIVVPVPTVRAHVRQRGFDHTLLLAQHIAKRRDLSVDQSLVRITSTKQRDASRAQRIAQARQAFAVHGKLDPSAVYVLVDDVVTTGATMRYAAKALRDAGAAIVWAGAVVRQTIDEQGVIW